MGLDRYIAAFKPIKSTLTLVSHPLYLLSNGYISSILSIKRHIEDKNVLTSNNDTLRQELLQLKQKLSDTASLIAENKKLRSLLHYVENKKIDSQTILADIISIDNNPVYQKITVNRGLNSNIYIGQTVLDKFGLLGQVISVNQINSTVLLITDLTHLTPVKISRTGHYFIAEGSGNNKLKLLYVPINTDIKKGDLIVTSGLGKRFPKNYPIGTIDTITTPKGRSFLNVSIQSSVNKHTDRLVLLYFNKQTAPSEQLKVNK